MDGIRALKLATLVAPLTWLAACGEAPPAANPEAPPAADAAHPSPPREWLADVTREAGIDFVHVHGGSGSGSGERYMVETLRLHFGLRQATGVDRLEIRWPEGETLVIDPSRLDINTVNVLRQPPR